MLNNIIKKMKSKSEVYMNEQLKEEYVEHFFKEELKCKYIPKEVLEFYTLSDGCRISIIEIFSIVKIKKELEANFIMFQKAMGIDVTTKRYIPIANDGMGGYYAFLADCEEENIYYLDHEFPEKEPYKYQLFEELLEELLEIAD